MASKAQGNQPQSSDAEQSNGTQPESQGPAVQPDNPPTSAEVGAQPQGPVDPAPPVPQTVVLQQPEDEPAVYYGPGGIEAPAVEHHRADYQPLEW